MDLPVCGNPKNQAGLRSIIEIEQKHAIFINFFYKFSSINWGYWGEGRALWELEKTNIGALYKISDKLATLTNFFSRSWVGICVNEKNEGRVGNKIERNFEVKILTCMQFSLHKIQANLFISQRLGGRNSCLMFPPDSKFYAVSNDDNFFLGLVQ